MSSKEKRSKKATTGRKATFVEGREYEDTETGERVQARAVNIEQRDFNFQKIWVGLILEAVDELGSAKLKVLGWLMDNVNYDNLVVATQREIAEGSGTSRGTVARTLKILDEHDILSRRVGSVMLNPNVVFQGGHYKRMNVLMRYREREEAPEEEENARKPKRNAGRKRNGRGQFAKEENKRTA